MVTVDVHITTVEGVRKTEPYGDYNRCDNCGKSIKEARDIITGGQLCSEEWACCEECADEMLKKGCTFEELGDMTYRCQKY